MYVRVPVLSLETVTDSHAVPGAEVVGSLLLDTFLHNCGPSVRYQSLSSWEAWKGFILTGGRSHTGHRPRVAQPRRLLQVRAKGNSFSVQRPLT